MGSGREKRTRVGSVGGRSRLGTGDVDVDADADADRDTPGSSAPGPSSSSETSSDSSSDLTPPSPPQQIPVEPETPALPPPPPHSQTKSTKPKLYVPKDNNVNRNERNSKALTRRQRKALGLPKLHLPQQRSSSSATGGAGKIIIPGGKWKGRQSDGTVVSVVHDGEGGGNEEWRMEKEWDWKS